MNNQRRNAMLGLAAASAMIAAAADIGRLIRDSIVVRTAAEMPVKLVAYQREAEIPADKAAGAIQAYQAASGQDQH